MSVIGCCKVVNVSGVPACPHIAALANFWFLSRDWRCQHIFQGSIHNEWYSVVSPVFESICVNRG